VFFLGLHKFRLDMVSQPLPDKPDIRHPFPLTLVKEVQTGLDCRY